MKIEAGKRYVRRDGTVSGVIEKIKTEDNYQFWDSVHDDFYNENGLMFLGKEHDKDLIREYVEPVSEQPEQTETLRDRFAMAALSAVLSVSIGNGWLDKYKLSKLSYEYADAMMEARKQ